MRELFDDILNIDGVKGLILLSFRGEIIFRELNHIVPENVENRDWRLLIESLANIRETDLIFEKGRLYIRRTEPRISGCFDGLFCPDRHDATAVRHIAAVIKACQSHERDPKTF